MTTPTDNRTRRPTAATIALGAAIVAVTALAAWSLLGGGGADWSRANPASLPNIVVIQTDDQTLGSFNRRTMPRTTRLLADRGTTFSDYVVSSPLCCPSRASLLTGQYPHNNRVTSNVPGYGALDSKRNTLPAWLQRAGYRTAHVGKYLNRWELHDSDPADPLPGWDDWVTMIPPYDYFGYELAENGERVRYGDSDGDYLTTVLNRHAKRIVAEQLPRREPLFLALDQLAPHGQAKRRAGSCGKTAQPLPGDFRRFARERLPTPPSFDEADIDDKPSFRRLVSGLSSSRIKSIRTNYRCRLASLRAVDRGVARIHDAVRSAGELDRTVFVFTSDNGFLQGEHRIPGQKAQPYEEAVRVPLVVRAPKAFRGGAPRVPATGVAASNIDLAPTILQLARAVPCRSDSSCRTMDGRSLIGPLTGRDDAWPRDRAILIGFMSGHEKNNKEESCEFSAFRTSERAYVEHRSVPDPKDGYCRPRVERELYDLPNDPYQLENLVPEDDAGGIDPELAVRLNRLERCAGIAGRDERVDDRPHCE